MKKRLEHIDEIISAGSFKADWASLEKFDVPNWFRRAKFGIFVHWGLYTVPQFGNEWYSRNMYLQGMPEFDHHIKTYGSQKDVGYKDFIPMFTAEAFDPDEWADLFNTAGARYFVQVAEHHDGFQMYRSDISRYNTYNMGPKRDILGEIKTAVEKKGIIFAASSHRAEHWFFMGFGKTFDSDIKEPLKRGDFYWPAMPEPKHHDLFGEPYPTDEFLQDWLLRGCELIDRYQPNMLYFDWWIQHEAFKPYLQKLAAYYYNLGETWGKQVAITYKHDAMMFGTAIPDVERGRFSGVKPFYWQADTSIANNSWCYTDLLQYKTAEEIVCTLIDIVSKNGNLLLNVGPRADGSIAQQDRMILERIGTWMDVNGCAIYDSKVWRKSIEGPTKETEGQFSEKRIDYTSEDIRFTVTGTYLNAFVLKYPKDGKVLIRSLANTKDQNTPEFHGIITDVNILGFDEKPTWNKTPEGLTVQTQHVKSDMPVVLRVKIK